jgi:hypothetical protein
MTVVTDNLEFEMVLLLDLFRNSRLEMQFTLPDLKRAFEIFKLSSSM